MAKFFIDRPIFAIVIAIAHDARGRACRSCTTADRAVPDRSRRLRSRSRRTYPGASAQTVEEHGRRRSIEQQMSGLDHLLLHVLDQRRLRHGARSR